MIIYYTFREAGFVLSPDLVSLHLSPFRLTESLSEPHRLAVRSCLLSASHADQGILVLRIKGDLIETYTILEGRNRGEVQDFPSKE